MTDFLYLNELSIPVAYAQAQVQGSQFGEYLGRSVAGTLRRSARAVKSIWSVATPPLDLDNADVLQSLILGLGHHWAFDSHFYSDKNLGPNAGYSACTIATTTPSPQVGTAYLEVPSAGSIVFATGFTLDWCWLAMVNLNGAGWVHRAYSYDASAAALTQYQAGSSGTYGTGLYTMSAGSLTLKGRNLADDADHANQFDDLVVLPCVATPELVTAHKTATTAGRPFSSLPALRMTGEIVDLASTATPIQVMGVLKSQPYVLSANDAGTWDTKRRSVAFDLVEV